MSLAQTVQRLATACVLSALSALSACKADSTAITPDTSANAESARVLARLAITGSPESPTGASWTYRDTVAGVAYDLAGVLIKPSGAGPFPRSSSATAAAVPRRSTRGTLVRRWRDGARS